MIKFSTFCKHFWNYVREVGQDWWRWELKRDIIYWIDYNNKNEFIIIPKWFVFDFNSAPIIAYKFVDKKEYKIALIHDYLYSKFWKIEILDFKNLSRKFLYFQKKANLWKNNYFLETENSITKNFIKYNRKFADLLWLYWAWEEDRAIKINLSYWYRFKVLIWYYVIRIFGKKYFLNK